jgi:hypothetical protein
MDSNVSILRHRTRSIKPNTRGVELRARTRTTRPHTPAPVAPRRAADPVPRYFARAGTWGDDDGNVLGDHFDVGEFEDRVAFARLAHMSAGEHCFIDDLKHRYDAFCSEAFCSPRQAAYLRELSLRGGWDRR